MFASKPPTCTGRTLDLSRKDSDIRHLRHLGNPDIAEKFTGRWPVKAPDTMRARIVKADEARIDAALARPHPAPVGAHLKPQEPRREQVQRAA